mgnify:CR=1 FL=1
MPTISIIIPTIGRQTLCNVLQSLVGQVIEGDEIMVVQDGIENRAFVDTVVRSYDLPITHCICGPTHSYGNAQRNFGISIAQGDYLSFMDDDDVYTPDALSIIRENVGSVPILFRMQYHDGRYLWTDPILRMGNVGTPMIVVPNVQDKIGQFTGMYEGDWYFIDETVKLWDGAVDWCEDVIARIRPHA